MVKDVEVFVIGGGPAGLCAAKAAVAQGAKVFLCERDDALGGQLVKQTHKFFGSEKEGAGNRGIHIAKSLIAELEAMPEVEILKNATVVGRYEDGVIGIEVGNEFLKVKPQRLVIATGASEKFLEFPGNDLPGIYGAGAVQTLMNKEGIKPADRVLMIGAGNIGLIVSYQLKQAGVEVAAVIEAAPKIGGYLVHASKIRRAGIPIMTKHSILRAYGEGKLEGAVITELDEKWQPVPGTEQDVKCDTICLAVGLTPMAEICWQCECEMKFVRELSGYVPVVDNNLETTTKGVFVAGDTNGIEEASAAMVEGKLAGTAAAQSLGYDKDAEAVKEEARLELKMLRAGPLGAKIRQGIEKVQNGGRTYVNVDRYTE